MDNPGVRVPPPLVIVGTLLLGLDLDGRLTAWPEFMFITTLFGGLVGSAGLAIIARTFGLFRKAETRAEPWQPATALVRSGVHKVSRNPMYLGMLATYGGVALAMQSVSALLLLLPLFMTINWFVVRREEAYLQRRFGSAYDEYRREVRRWI